MTKLILTWYLLTFILHADQEYKLNTSDSCIVPSCLKILFDE